jgi:hypothetical protein
VQGAFLDFLHGHGDLGTVAQRVGGTIVDAALQAQIKRFSDPLVQTVTQEILAIEGLTDAVTVLNGTIGGGGSVYGTGPATSGMSAAVAAGVQAGMEDGGGIAGGAASGGAEGANGARGAVRQSDLQKGAGAALAAYSIGATSAQQGVNAGNLLGGIATGASIGATFGPGGALIGGAIGGVVDLIGGLFHHADKPTEQPRDLNPAYYNAYVDGAAVAARQEISRQTTLATVSLTNLNLDRHAPN